jgi:F-type H+-transporting ATPase subunit epsilon
MSGALHLVITTPEAILVDRADVSSLRAEDSSGGFGILPGHTDLLTVLPPSVLRWRDATGVVAYCALRGGVMTVTGGRDVAVACRQGLIGDDLAALETEVQALRATEADAERRARVEQVRLHSRVVRQLMRYLRPGSMMSGELPGTKDDAP